MDSSLAALSSAAATTLVTLIATDSWEQVKMAFVRLWRRCHPGEASTVEADLAAARTQVMAARLANDEKAEAAVAEEWQSRLRQLVGRNESIHSELEELVEELRLLFLGVDQGGSATMHATASGFARIYQAGRDQTVRTDQ